MNSKGKTTHKPDRAGHRQRLRQRFMKGGADALPDYELLELTLFAALPRRDTKPLAKMPLIADDIPQKGLVDSSLFA